MKSKPIELAGRGEPHGDELNEAEEKHEETELGEGVAARGGGGGGPEEAAADDDDDGETDMAGTCGVAEWL